MDRRKFLKGLAAAVPVAALGGLGAAKAAPALMEYAKGVEVEPFIASGKITFNDKLIQDLPSDVDQLFEGAFAKGGSFKVTEGTRTLAEAANGCRDELTEGVIDSILETNRIFKDIPFDPIPGGALKYNRASDLLDKATNNVRYTEEGTWIDGWGLVDGDKVLIKGAANPENNGVYVVNSTEDGFDVKGHVEAHFELKAPDYSWPGATVEPLESGFESELTEAHLQDIYDSWKVNRSPLRFKPAEKTFGFYAGSVVGEKMIPNDRIRPSGPRITGYVESKRPRALDAIQSLGKVYTFET
jgi:hypothetical protein